MEGVSVASEEAGFGPGLESLILLTTSLSISAKQDKTQCTRVTKQLFGQGQSQGRREPNVGPGPAQI